MQLVGALRVKTGSITIIRLVLFLKFNHLSAKNATDDLSRRRFQMQLVGDLRVKTGSITIYQLNKISFISEV